MFLVQRARPVAQCTGHISMALWPDSVHVHKLPLILPFLRTRGILRDTCLMHTLRLPHRVSYWMKASIKLVQLFGFHSKLGMLLLL